MVRVKAKACAALLVLAVALTGCSLSKRIQRASDKMEARYAKITTWEKLPVRTISWNQAIAMIRTNNTSIMAARNNVKSADRETLRVYTDLVPGVSYYAYMSKSLNDVARQWNGNDLNNNFNVNFFLPTLTQLPYRVYANKVRAFAAVKACEGAEREAVSKLYQAVRKREIALKTQALDAELPPETAAAPSAAGGERDKQDLDYYQAVAELLGNADARWNILPETMPRIQWKDFRNRLDRLDPLVLCNFVMQLEQARMEQYSVALQYLPTVNLSLYSPSLFTSSGGTYTGTFLSGEDTTLNMSVSYQFDTHLTNWNRYRDSQERYEVARRKVEADMRDHKSKIEALRRSVDEYENWKGYMAKRMDFIRKSPVEDAASFLERNRTIVDMKREMLKQEQESVETEAALILEYGMPGLSPMKFD